MSMNMNMLEFSKAKYRPQAEGTILRPAFGKTVSRSSVACRHHQACFESLPAFPAAVGEEASTSGQSISNIPSVLDSLIQRLPARSKRRKLLVATNSLSSLVSKWNGDLR